MAERTREKAIQDLAGANEQIQNLRVGLLVMHEANFAAREVLSRAQKSFLGKTIVAGYKLYGVYYYARIYMAQDFTYLLSIMRPVMI